MKKNGFSLIELLAVVSILGVLFLIVIANYPALRQQLDLNRAAHQLVQDIRGVQEMAMSSTKIEEEACPTAFSPLHFSSSDYFALGGHIAQSPFISCYSSPDYPDAGDPVTFISEITGGSGSYTYLWSGDCVGSEANCTQSFPERGGYQADVTVSQNGETIGSSQCYASVYGPFSDPDVELIGGQDFILNSIAAKGFGIYINLSSNKSYILYIDTTKDCEPEECWGYYNSGDCVYKTIPIGEKGIIIKQINNIEANHQYTSINFRPPNPDINIEGIEENEQEIEIVLAVESDSSNPSKQKIVTVNRAGLVEVK